MQGFGRAGLLTAVAALIGVLAAASQQPRHVAPASAPATTFSALRAEVTLARVLAAQRPHPVSSAAQDAVRARIVGEFAALGVPVQVYRAFTCNIWRGFAYIPCATVTDLIADVVPGQGPAIVMMAHYDSVPAGPGASDDASGVAILLETARALRSRRRHSLHPVIALITDGEEPGLLGAAAFLQNPALKQRAGVVVNAEARGTSGSSLLFQTSAGNGRLIDLYARHVPRVATSSLYAEIYRYLPNDTDLTLFLRAGIPGFNFAFAANERYYHTPLDLRCNLDPATLQMQGDSVLGVVGALEQTPYAALRGGNDAYFSVFGAFVPRLPQRWMLPLAIAAFLGMALAAMLAGRRHEPVPHGPAPRAPGPRDSAPQLPAPQRPAPQRPAPQSAAPRALLMPVLLLAAAVALGDVLALVARLLSGMPDPAYAYPPALRIALAAGLWALTLVASRLCAPRAAAAGVWLWLCALGIAAAAWLPGLSPYFVFPAVIAAVLLLIAARLPAGWKGPWGQAALLIAALAMLVPWLELCVAAQTLMGLRQPALFMLPAAFAVLPLVPLLAARPMSARAWQCAAAGATAAALLCAIIAGLLPAYSTASPQRVDLVYYEDRGGADWLADSSWKAHRAEPIPAALMRAAGFVRTQRAYPVGLGGVYVAPAGRARLALPTATVTHASAAQVAAQNAVRAATQAAAQVAVPGAASTVAVHLQGSAAADAMVLYIPRAVGLRRIDVRGQHLVPPRGWSGPVRVLCVSRDCRDVTLALTMTAVPTRLVFEEERYGLPAFGAYLQAARPPAAMPSQSGDEVILLNSVEVP